MKTFLKIFIVLILIIAIFAVIAFFAVKSWYNRNLEAVGGKEVVVEIASKTSTVDIAELLEKEKVIKNATVFKIYVKLNNINNLQAGKYKFDTSKEDVKAVVEKLSKGDVYEETVKITFVEGKTMVDYAKLIAEKTNNTEEDVYNLLGDEEYIDSLIEKYWFLTDEIKNPSIYYPLEGYLKADTYTFENADVSVKYIFSFLLNYTEKFLDQYREEIENSDYTVHELLTLASITEKEAETPEDRKGVASVLYNRLNKNWSLGCDVTTYYAFMAWGRAITKEELNTENPYNTRGPNMNGKLPVGPICSLSESSIVAAIEPYETDFMYFVSDTTNKVYFAQTETQFSQIQRDLKAAGMWPEY